VTAVPDGFLAPPGTPIAVEAITVGKARALVEVLSGGAIAFVTFVEARRVPAGDVVVFDVDPEVPQQPAADIRRRERIAVTFFDSDDRVPETVALRESFPRTVPHLNLRPAAEPWASLCLYEERYADLKLRWTAAGYLRRVHEWLSRTAQQTLHQPDQRLEPFIIPSAVPLVISPSLLSAEWDEEGLDVLRAGDDRHTVLIARRGASGATGFRAIRVTVEPAVHGAILHEPRTLADLHDLLSSRGTNLAAILRGRLAALEGRTNLLDACLVLVLTVPALRAVQGPVEATDVYAFMTVKTLREIGVALDVWQIHRGRVGRVLASDSTRTGVDVEIATLSPIVGLSREAAALVSGEEAARPRVLAVGAGMLGSQVITSLVRSGYGEWTIVDHDHMLPHNLVRHQLDGAALGLSKAKALAEFLNGLFDDEKVARAIEVDVLRTGEPPELREALDKAQVILDTSASATVARHLAVDVVSPGRRVSLFLNPDGTDLVLLAEDERRETRLDDLEMQYYRAIVRDRELQDHLRPAGGRVRYGQSCRDVTTRIPQHRAAIAAGTGAAAVRRCVAAPGPAIRMLRMTADLEVRSVEVPAATPCEYTVGKWTVRSDEVVQARLRELRAAALPSETGGILVGHHDMQRHILYVVDALPAPPDSEGRPVFFTRGCEGLQQHVCDMESMSGGSLTYVGEWHSHPDGCSVLPSRDDDEVLAWLGKHLEVDGLPAVISIVGEHLIAFYFGGVS
jgi:hypothetical protein